MPITKSAKKSLRVSKTKQAQNRVNTVRLEKAIRTVSKENINNVISLIDKAAKTGIIHKNKAARLKSSLMKKFGTEKKLKTKSVNVKTALKSFKAKEKAINTKKIKK